MLSHHHEISVCIILDICEVLGNFLLFGVFFSGMLNICLLEVFVAVKKNDQLMLTCLHKKEKTMKR